MLARYNNHVLMVFLFFYKPLSLCITFRFFQQLNTEVYQSLINVDGDSCEDHVMTCEMVQLIGLHLKDHIFLTELASLHSLNVTVQRQSDAFPCCI